MIKHMMEQGSYEWHEIRRGKLTSTGLKSVLTPTGKPNLVIYEMIAEEISGQSDDEDTYVSDKMQRGVDLEPLARKEYERKNLIFTEQVGFLQSTKWERLGVSADSLVGDTGAIEIKCPDTKTHVRYILEQELPKEYFYQFLCYFLVHEELRWLDFVSYDPRFTVHPLFIRRIQRTDMEGELKVAEVKLNKFFQEYENKKNLIIFGNSMIPA